MSTVLLYRDGFWHCTYSLTLRSPELGVQYWKGGAYLSAASLPPAVIDVSLIQCHVARGTLRRKEQALWITIPMDRVSAPYEYSRLELDLTG